MVRLFLMFSFVLQDVRWVGCTRAKGVGLPWISFGNRRGERRKWPLFLRGPILHLCVSNPVERWVQEKRRTALLIQVVQLEEAFEVKRISTDPVVGCAQET